MANFLFFEASRRTFDQVTGMFDFFWPTAAAMWNLRWQVDGYLRVRPDVTPTELSNRFVVGSDIHGANLKRACVEQTWEKQQEEFAKFLLINIFAIHESYLKIVLDDIGRHNQDLVKQLQFPTGIGRTGQKTGVWGAIDNITLLESTMLKNAFYSSLLAHSKNKKANLDNLMKCYRYFKECRNSLAHNGGSADVKAVAAYNDFTLVANTRDLGVKEVPHHSAIILGAPIHLSLRGVVGFCDIVLKIIVTIDAELSRSTSSEKIFKKYWFEMHGRKYTLKTNNAEKKARQLSRLVGKLHLPLPRTTDEIELYLKNNGLVN
jgi:hypothetical protein